jgi:hypothetical protein
LYFLAIACMASTLPNLYYVTYLVTNVQSTELL